VSCDFSGNVPGDPCPFSKEGDGICSLDGHSRYICTGGVFMFNMSCPGGCVVSGSQITCQS
jgi:hypothetical protein